MVIIWQEIWQNERSPGSSVSTVTTLRAGWPVLDYREGQGISLFPTACRLALGPTHHIQWIPEDLSSAVKRPGREDNNFIPLVERSPCNMVTFHTYGKSLGSKMWPELVRKEGR